MTYALFSREDKSIICGCKGWADDFVNVLNWAAYAEGRVGKYPDSLPWCYKMMVFVLDHYDRRAISEAWLDNARQAVKDYYRDRVSGDVEQWESI